MEIKFSDIDAITDELYLVTLVSTNNVTREYKLNVNNGSVIDQPYHMINRRVGRIGLFGNFAKLFIKNEVWPILKKLRNEDNKREMLKIYFYLKDSANSLFNRENIPVSVRIISVELNIPEISVAYLCNKLHNKIPFFDEVKAGGKYPFYRVKVG